jgi:cytochrome subunit of sulfide dehydrogenase
MGGRLRIRFSIAVTLVLLGSRVGVAADADQGAQLAAACAACHGPAGVDQGIPTIAGLDERKIVDAMQAFRRSEALSQVMHAVALSLTDEELASVAEYLATHSGEARSP